MNFIKLKKWIDPEKVFESLFAKEENAYWLDSSLENHVARFSYMGIPSDIITYSLSQKSPNIFSQLEKLLKEKKINQTNLPFDFVGGYVGYFGYELKTFTGTKNKHRSPYPDSLWFYAENFLVFDLLEKEIYLVSLNKNNDWLETLADLLLNIKNVSPKIKPARQHGINFTLSKSHDQYIKDIETCKNYLKRGESYQICLTNMLHAKQKVDSFLLYKTLRKNNPAPYSVFLKYKDLAILSSSPEQFLKINSDRTVETKPIKGTIRRGKTSDEDLQLLQTLKTHQKEWSENAMIVDLLRNDLGKVCEFGSIHVSKLMDIESYATLHQMVSTIRGKLREDVSVIDCIKACFPGGSMTGVPKLRTMKLLDDLENEARGIYSGAIGFLSFNNTATLNIAIRTIIVKGENISIGAGGAIVFDSDPEKEFEEMHLKAKVLIETIRQVTGSEKHKIFLALGSNVGERKKNIITAVELLGEKIESISVANVVESEPMYYENQDTFFNTVLSGETYLSPKELLQFIKKLEKKIGRIKRFQNGPREIDIDILFYDDLVYKEEQLEIPHPKMSEREFVLKPFMDLEPEFIHPVFKKTMREMYKELKNKCK